MGHFGPRTGHIGKSREQASPESAYGNPVKVLGSSLCAGLETKIDRIIWICFLTLIVPGWLIAALIDRAVSDDVVAGRAVRTMAAVSACAQSWHRSPAWLAWNAVVASDAWGLQRHLYAALVIGLQSCCSIPPATTGRLPRPGGQTHSTPRDAEFCCAHRDPYPPPRSLARLLRCIPHRLACAPTRYPRVRTKSIDRSERNHHLGEPFAGLT